MSKSQHGLVMQNLYERQKQTFFHAIINGAHILLDTLLGENPALLLETDLNGLSGLKLACSLDKPNVDVIKTLLKYCISPDYLNLLAQ